MSGRSNKCNCGCFLHYYFVVSPSTKEAPEGPRVDGRSVSTLSGWHLIRIWTPFREGRVRTSPSLEAYGERQKRRSVTETRDEIRRQSCIITKVYSE